MLETQERCRNRSLDFRGSRVKSAAQGIAQLALDIVLGHVAVATDKLRYIAPAAGIVMVGAKV